MKKPLSFEEAWKKQQAAAEAGEPWAVNLAVYRSVHGQITDQFNQCRAAVERAYGESMKAIDQAERAATDEALRVYGTVREALGESEGV